MEAEREGLYRVKAAHMHRLAEQAQNSAARLTYRSLEVAWLTLAQRSGELRERFWSAKGAPDEVPPEEFPDECQGGPGGNA